MRKEYGFSVVRDCVAIEVDGLRRRIEVARDNKNYAEVGIIAAKLRGAGFRVAVNEMGGVIVEIDYQVVLGWDKRLSILRGGGVG